MNRKIILASSSPRRSDILSIFTDKFEIYSPEIEEIEDGNNPEKLAEVNAELKCEECAKVFRNHEVIIACDTIVYKSEIYGKPKDERDAFTMLMSLSGKSHKAITGYCIIDTHNHKKYLSSCVTEVVFKTLDGDEIEKYLSFGEYKDKAGAYSIQGKSNIFIDKIIGDHYNVMGMPISDIYAVLKKEFDIDLLDY